MYLLFSIGNVLLFFSALMSVWMMVAYTIAIRWTKTIFGRKLFSLLLLLTSVLTLLGLYDTSRGILFHPAAMPPLWYLVSRIVIFSGAVIYIPWYTYRFVIHAGMHPKWVSDSKEDEDG